MPPNSKQQKWSHNIVWLVAVILLSVDSSVKGDSSIPHLCDNVKCPDLSEITCPDDSSVRELLAEPLIAINEENEDSMNATTTSITDEEIFSQCCLNKKCICKLCHIPDCHNDEEVVVELEPESIDLPGYCCGKYECQLEPNCTEVQDTDSYWLTDCQRCKCYAGQRICHQSCDEGIKKPAMCHAKNLNTFYEHGQRWKDGCYDCECLNGEANCMITFCRGLACPKHRQVMLKDSCCPVCWPKGFAMPNNNDEEYDEESENENDVESGNHYDDDNIGVEPIAQANDDYSDNEEQVEVDLQLKPIDDIIENTTISVASITSSTTTTTTKPVLAETKTLAVEIIKTSSSTTTNTPCINDNLASSTTTAEPCNNQESPATYKVYRQVVELMPYSQHNDLLYTIIGCLSVIVVILAAWNIHLKAKQRSYRPVSNFDDNFNRMSSNIKKTNDYV